MRILVAPDKFKGSLTAVQAGRAIAKGLRQIWHDADIRELPIADGGEGTADAIRAARNGVWISRSVHGPFGETVEAGYAWLEETKTAVIEMSAASGLWRVAAEKRDPLRATTRGTGDLIADAMERGARQIIVGLGGSATNDGGAGMASALGFRFLTSDGEPVEAVPANFLALVAIKPPENFMPPPIVAACDVRNPLLGARGASRIYGPQKGADERTVETLEQALENLADVCVSDLGRDFRNTPGAGAAGGLGFGLLTFCNAEIRSGFDLVAEILDLENAIAASDLVVTAEGRLDAQTLEGKGPAGVAALARKHGKPVIAFGGSIEDDARLHELFDAVVSITQEPMPLERALKEAATLLERSAARTARLLRIGI